MSGNAARLHRAAPKRVLLAGRLNRPRRAAGVVANGKACMVGLARGLVADNAIPV